MWPISGKRLSKNAHQTLPRKPVPPTTTSRLPAKSLRSSSGGVAPFTFTRDVSAISDVAPVATSRNRHVAHDDGRYVQAGDVQGLVLAVLGAIKRIFHVGRGLVAEQLGDVLVVRAGHDDAADVLPAV